MLGTVVNSITIILGSIFGFIIKRGIKDEYKKTIMDGVGLAVIVIGLMGAIKTENTILAIISIVLGSLFGEILGIERKLNSLGDTMEERFGKGDSNFSKGFVTALPSKVIS